MNQHEDCAHVIHSRLVDEMTVRFFPFDSTNTIHRKMQEHCSEEIIIHKLKQYISEFGNSINKCEEQLEIYTCHLHSSIQISRIGDLVIDLEVQALKTGVTIVKQFNYFWPKSLFEELWKETHVMADLVWAPGFNHRASHYMDCITRYEYVIGGARPRVRKGFQTPRKGIQNQPSVFKLSLTSYPDILKNYYKNY